MFFISGGRRLGLTLAEAARYANSFARPGRSCTQWVPSAAPVFPSGLKSPPSPELGAALRKNKWWDSQRWPEPSCPQQKRSAGSGAPKFNKNTRGEAFSSHRQLLSAKRFMETHVGRHFHSATSYLVAESFLSWVVKTSCIGFSRLGFPRVESWWIFTEVLEKLQLNNNSNNNNYNNNNNNITRFYSNNFKLSSQMHLRRETTFSMSQSTALSASMFPHHLEQKFWIPLKKCSVKKEISQQTLQQQQPLTLAGTSATNTAEVKWDTDNELQPALTTFISIIRFFW